MSFKKNIQAAARARAPRPRARALAIQSGHSEYISGLFTCRVQRFSAWELFFSYIFEIISIYQAFLHSTKYEQLRHGTNRAVNVSKAVGIKNLNNFSRFFFTPLAFKTFTPVSYHGVTVHICIFYQPHSPHSRCHRVTYPLRYLGMG